MLVNPKKWETVHKMIKKNYGEERDRGISQTATDKSMGKLKIGQRKWRTCTAVVSDVISPMVPDTRRSLRDFSRRILSAKGPILPIRNIG